MPTLKNSETKMAQALEHLKTELKNIRTGRANPGMLDAVAIEVYGTQMRLKDVATVSVPEQKQLLITPFDGNNAGAIRKSIEKANLGVQPVLDGNTIRITLPPMDESVRKSMVQLCHKKKEEAKITVRKVRQEGNNELKKKKSLGDISEDDQKRDEKKIQDLTDKFCKEADKLAQEKEKDVLTI